MAKKTFKTLAGALNHTFDQFRLAAERAGRPRDRVSIQRQAINSMLPQIGVDAGIGVDEKPFDAITRMHAAESDATRKQQLNEILRWFNSTRQQDWTVTSRGHSTYQSGGVSRVIIGDEEDAETETRQFNGFGRKARGTSAKRFMVILDIPTAFNPTPFAAAEKIAGPDICFTTSHPVTEAVPDDCKGVLLTEEELYARVPELAPKPPRHRRRRA